MAGSWVKMVWATLRTTELKFNALKAQKTREAKTNLLRFELQAYAPYNYTKKIPRAFVGPYSKVWNRIVSASLNWPPRQGE